MPLRDRFHPPLSVQRHWQGFHSAWANELVRQLNEDLLPAPWLDEDLAVPVNFEASYRAACEVLRIDA